MNLTPSIKYQAKNTPVILLWYYLILVALFVIATVLSSAGSAQIGLGGEEIAPNLNVDTDILPFILGLTTFKANFLISQQNSISRKNQFISHMIFSLLLVGILLIMDLVVFPVILRLVRAIIVGYDISLTTIFGFFKTLSLREFMQTFMYYSFVMSLGYFITILFYRLKTVGKVIIGGFVPIAVFMVLPIVDFLFFKQTIISNFIIFGDKLAAFVSNANIFVYALYYILIIVIVRGLAWLLMRKTVVK